MFARRYILLLSLSLPFLAMADLATVHLPDGKSTTVELVSVDEGQVKWKDPLSTTAPVQSYLRSQVDHVDFPPTGLWKDAEASFQSGDLDNAIKLYQEVIADPYQHFYNIPGNFVSLAKARILEVHRARMDAAAIEKQAQVVREEFSNLPPAYRQVDPVVTAWIALAKEDWDGILSALDSVELPGAETFFLRGRALEAQGEWEEAVREYAGAYVLNFGGSTRITQTALERSANLLAASGDEDRTAELQAQAKIYRDLFGKGSLWTGAPDWVSELADGKISTANADIDDSKMQKPAENTGGAVATQTETEATVTPAEERDWLLASEIDRKVYVMNNAELEVENLGGVKKTGDGYEFDGTGGGLKFSALDGRSTIWIVKCIFVPQEKDGAFFDLSTVDKRGFGIYLKGGKLVAVWNPAKGRGAQIDLGEIKVGTQHTLYFSVNQRGILRGRLDEHDAVEARVDRRGLSFGASVNACLGDTGSSDEDTFTADGNTYTPFKGSIPFFALGYGSNGKDIAEGEKSQFGGKVVRFRPPESEEPKPEPKPEPEPTAEKPAEKVEE